MKYKNLQIKKKENLKSKIAITALALALLSPFAPFAYKAWKNYTNYDCAPLKEYKAKKGDSLWEYFETENTQKDLNFNSYKNLVMRLNDFYISGTEKNINDLDNLVVGRAINLPDVNRDGYVGKR